MIKAIDLDSGIDSEIAYKILENSTMSEKFGLENVTEGGGQRGRRRVVVTGDIDREETGPVLTISIEARELFDCTEDQCYSAITTCMLLVQDLNDNLPTFNSSQYVANVNENVNIGEPLDFLSAAGLSPRVEDRDVVYNSFSISFENESMNEYFNINPDTMVSSGLVRLSSSVSNNTLLDADSQPATLDIVVVAMDDDKPEFSDTAIFTINIIDVNDIEPKFEKAEYNVTVKEDLSNLDESKLLLKVTAEDGDKSPAFGQESLRYDFVPGKELGGLQMDSFTGEITVENNGTFDFESQREHNLEVRVRDCGEGEGCYSQYDTALLTIIVENVNDNPPRLNPDACERTFDNTISQDKILDITASDGDNDTVTFSMDGSMDTPFSIDNFGNNKGAITVDRSALVELEDIFIFNVTLTDNGNPPISINVPCTMNVRDVNDKDPVFTMPEPGRKPYWIRDDLEPNLSQPMTLYNGSDLVLTTEDADTNPCYSTANYFFHNLNPSYDSLFSLEASTGEIRLKDYLNDTKWESDEGIFNLITLPVEAKDGYGPDCSADSQTHRRAQEELLLKVFTNFEPHFSKDGNMEQESHDFNETVKEPGETATTLLPNHTFQAAVDDNNVDPPPGWQNQPICYYILSPLQSPFQLDKLTNTLMVSSSLDVDHCEDCSTYDIIIGATNNCQDQPPDSAFDVSSKLLAKVTVRDLNDNAPVFTDIRSYYVYSTIEGECKDCDISAEDDDIGNDITIKKVLVNMIF